MRQIADFLVGEAELQEAIDDGSVVPNVADPTGFAQFMQLKGSK
jgi:hypothetical protein